MAKHAFISAHKTAYSIRHMCRVLKVSTSWFHACQKSEGARQAKAKRELDLVAEIRRVIKENKSCYGPLRVFHKLLQEGIECTAYMIRKLMNLHDIRQSKRNNWGQ
ncbi:IS3 family transposase [Terasakiella pusilla]|uniref:IS3 family transposase n=1 Tax=Terasakiella pusilla TaxID=64973 RepID=UPI00069164B9|nr:IS3 family transposase [Terasakiella pusilla]